MKILFVTHFLPYPPNDGGRIGYYNPLKYLSRRHEIILATITNGDQQKDIDGLRAFCTEVISYTPSSVERRLRLARAAFGTPPGTAGKYFYPGFGRMLAEVIQRRRPDIVELQHLNTAAYLPYCSGPVPILREHNVEYKVWERYTDQIAPGPLRWGMRWLSRRVRRYEASMAPKFVRCVCVSKADELFLRQLAPSANVLTIPSGVDAEYFVPDSAVAEEPYSMVLTGSFVWKPKQHNLRRLITEIFPRIRALEPRAQLTVVGKGVPPALAELAKSQGVIVTGMVPDVRAYVHRASLVLNYLEAGGGIALKVLEAFAMRKAVLSNALGVEGIEVQPDVHCAVENEPDAFARAAAELLRDAHKRQELADSGHQLVKREYAWHSLARSFEDLYHEALPSHSKLAVGYQQ